MCSGFFLLISFCYINVQSYQPGYIAPPPRPRPEETTIDIGQILLFNMLERFRSQKEKDSHFKMINRNDINT